MFYVIFVLDSISEKCFYTRLSRGRRWVVAGQSIPTGTQCTEQQQRVGAPKPFAPAGPRVFTRFLRTDRIYEKRVMNEIVEGI